MRSPKLFDAARLFHRTLGATLGLLLVLLGASGALLANRDLWTSVPHAAEAQIRPTLPLADLVSHLASGDERPQRILLATDSFPLHRLSLRDGAGAYADATGKIVARWDSKWERPELWLFDLHHYLLAGDAGETLAGVAALCGLFFLASGIYLWWPMRKSFRLRLLPARLSKTAILQYHRNLGVVIAPLLAMSLVTGAMMVFRPMTALLGITAPATITQALTPPALPKMPMASNIDWRSIISDAQKRFPDAEVRMIFIPHDAGTVDVGLRQSTEWLPNGRTMIWYSPASGLPLMVRDARMLPQAVQAYNLVYPLHSGKMGSIWWRIAVTIAGLSMAVVGGLTIMTYWLQKMGKRGPAGAN